MTERDPVAALEEAVEGYRAGPTHQKLVELLAELVLLVKAQQIRLAELDAEPGSGRVPLRALLTAASLAGMRAHACERWTTHEAYADEAVQDADATIAELRRKRRKGDK